MSDESLVTPPAPEFIPSRPQSGIMGLLAQRRQQIIDDLILTLEVPNWTSPKLKIEFKPVHHAILRRATNEQEKRTKDTADASKQANTELDTNADIIINGCVRIIAILDDGEEMGMGLDGAFTRFDRDLAIAAGMPETSNARQICRWLFVTDADLLRTARTVSKWSGYREEDVNEALEGE